MGEARRRKEHEATFGRVPKNAGKRGIVIGAGFRSTGPTSFTFEPSSTRTLLRHCLLDWDRIDWPDNNLVSQGCGPDEQFLVDAGVLRRTVVRYGGMFSGNLAPVLAQSQLHAFQFHEQQEPGVWSLAQSTDKLTFPGQAISERRALEVELYQGLPTVADDVPFQEILEFRSRYRSELLQLRSYMDGIYSEIVNSGDLTRTRSMLQEQLSSAIDDVERALHAQKLPTFKISWSMEFKLPDIAKNFFLGAAIAQIFGVPVALGGAASAALCALKAQLTSVQTPAASVSAGPFAYLYRAGAELRK